MPNADANFQSEVRRNDDAQIVAARRQDAAFLGVRLAYHASGYKAGEVLGRNSVSGLYMKYSDAGSSGESTAVCVLERAVAAAEFPSTTSQSVDNSVLTHAIFSGTVFYGKLTGIDANGITDLHGRRVIDATGVEVLMFG